MEQLVRNGSIVATIGHANLEEVTAYLLVMERGIVTQQAVIHRGHNLNMAFIGMSVVELAIWQGDFLDVIDLSGETRKLHNSFNEDTNVTYLHRPVQFLRPKRARYNGEGKSQAWKAFCSLMENGVNSKGGRTIST